MKIRFGIIAPRPLMAAIIVGLGFATTGGSASAQVNCSAAGTPQMRAWCLQQSAQIHQQQSQAYNSIARQQWQQHQRVGSTLSNYSALRGALTPDGIIAGKAAQAWSAPRYIYQYRHGRP